MSFFVFSLKGMTVAAASIATFIKENIILCSILFMSYFIFFIYNFIHAKSMETDIYEVDMVSNGVSSIITALLLIGLDESSKGFDVSKINFATQSTMIAFVLLGYGLLVIILGFAKILPKFVVILVGNSELDVFINFMAVLMTAEKVVINFSLILVILMPLSIMFLIQRIRKMTGGF